MIRNALFRGALALERWIDRGRLPSRLRGWIARQWCRAELHSYGYSPDHDLVFCFACGSIAPPDVWRELDPFRRNPIGTCCAGYALRASCVDCPHYTARLRR